MVLPGVAVEPVPWVGAGVTSTVGVPAGGGESVTPVVGGMVPVGTALSVVVAVAANVVVEVGATATGDVVAVGSDTAWAQAMSSNVASAARRNQRTTDPLPMHGYCAHIRAGISLGLDCVARRCGEPLRWV